MTMALFTLGFYTFSGRPVFLMARTVTSVALILQSEVLERKGSNDTSVNRTQDVKLLKGTSR